MDVLTERADIVEELLTQLADGKGLATICREAGMPNRRTVTRWIRDNADFAERVSEAREAGYLYLGEKALRDVQDCTDPIKARLIFDAHRWYLGKLSQAFAEKPVAIGAFVNVDAGDAFAAITGALDRAAAGIASRGTSTRAVVIESKTGSSDAGGELADMAGSGGSGMGKDADGG